MVVCSDRREYNRIQGAVDSTAKITQLGPRSAFVVTGAARVLDSTAQHVLFDVPQAVSQFFSNKELQDGDLEKYFDELSGYLAARYKASGVRLESSSIIQFTFAPLGRLVHITRCELLPDVKVRCSTIAIEKGTLIDGEVGVITEIVRGHDSRFDDLRKDLAFRSIWLNAEPSNNPIKSAVDFASKAITWTHERDGLKGSGPNLVSANYDCALVSPTNGFVWLARDTVRNAMPH